MFQYDALLVSRSLKTIEKIFSSSAHRPAHKLRGRGDDRRDCSLREDDVIAMARTMTGEYLRVTSKALHAMVKAGIVPAEFDCLQPFKGAKDYGTTGEFANYQHQYMLDDIRGGMSTGTAHRRVAVHLSGRGGEKFSKGPCNLILSRNARINAEISATARSIVLAVERSKLCRVLVLKTEFVLDEQDELWLAGVTSCKTAARPMAASGSMSSLSVKPSSRQPEADGTDQALEKGCANRGTTSGEGPTLHTEVRSRNREADEAFAVVSDDDFSLLLREVGYISPFGRSGRCGHSNKPINSSSRGKEQHRPRRLLVYGASETDSTGSTSTSPSKSNPALKKQEAGHGAMAESPTPFDWQADGPSGDEKLESGSGEQFVGRFLDQSQCPPQRSVSTEAFRSPTVKLDEAETNEIYGSSQVRGVGLCPAYCRWFYGYR